MKEPLYLCAYIPQFPAQALLRLRPELAQSPVAVVAGEPPFQQVCSLNAQAGKLGIVLGNTRAELDSFPGVCILRSAAAEERAARTVLLEAAGAFTPRVEVQPSAAADFAMVLDMTGTSRMFGSALQAIRRLTLSMQALRVHTRFAASANLEVAVCMAPYACHAPAVVPAGQERAALAALPLAALNLASQHAETFALWGLHTLGELAAIPELELVARLGNDARRLWHLACGRQPHLMVPEEPVFALQEFVALDSPVEILDSLLFVLGPMLDQLLARAQDRAVALASVTVKLGLDGGGEHERTVRPALPVLQREVLLKLLHLDLQAHPPGAGVLSVFVQAEPGDRSKVQMGLFAAQLPEALRLDVTLARIAALVGEHRVGQARLLDSHQPDSFAMERFFVPATTPELTTKPGAAARSGAATRLGLAERPGLAAKPGATAEPDAPAKPGAIAALRRCRPPVPVAVSQDRQQLATVTLRGKRYAVQASYGPWRRSGNWWSSDVWSREEWDVHASAGTEGTLLCVLAHDLLRGQWHMEALYD